MILLPLLAIALLVAVHLFSVKLRFLEVIPRSRWLSFAGGVSIALVFFEILPELSRSQEIVTQAVGGVLTLLENHIYIVAAFGLAVFYGVERIVKTSRVNQREAGKEDATGDYAFWLSMSVFSIKNLIVGYLILREPRPVQGLILFVIAIALEFLLTDRGLHEDHKANYERVGRWVLIAAVSCGWVIGYFTEIPRIWLAILSSFLAGAILLTAIKEELPEERQSRFWAFALGLGTYGTLLLLQ